MVSELKVENVFIIKGSVHSTITGECQWKFIMEVLNKGSLLHQLQKDNVSHQEKALCILHIADAMRYLHEHRVLHREHRVLHRDLAVTFFTYFLFYSLFV